jgi:TolB protein
MRAGGGGQKRLTTTPGFDGFPAWSAGGSRIAFTSASGGSFDIWTMARDGTARRRVTFNSASDAEPDWAPVGSRLAFQSNRSGGFDIWIVRPDGTHLRPAIGGPRPQGDPAWGPGARRIAYAQGGDIWSAAPNGSGRGRVTTTAATDMQPAWEPV